MPFHASKMEEKAMELWLFLDVYPIEYVYLYIGSNTHFGESSMTKRGLGSILTVNDKYMYTYRTYVVRVAC